MDGYAASIDFRLRKLPPLLAVFSSSEGTFMLNRKLLSSIVPIIIESPLLFYPPPVLEVAVGGLLLKRFLWSLSELSLSSEIS